MEKIVRNYLEIKSLDELLVEKKPSNNCSLEKVSSNDFQLNKFFYKQIGKNHQWVDRLAWTNKNWTEYVSSPNVFTFILRKNEDIAGFFELVYHKNTSLIVLLQLVLLLIIPLLIQFDIHKEVFSFLNFIK